MGMERGREKGRERKKEEKKTERQERTRTRVRTTHACIARMHAWHRRDIVGRLERGERERICGVARHATCQQSVNVHGQVSFHSRVKGCFPFSFFPFSFSLRFFRFSLSLHVTISFFFSSFFPFPFPSLLELFSSAIWWSVDAKPYASFTVTS